MELISGGLLGILGDLPTMEGGLDGAGVCCPTTVCPPEDKPIGADLILTGDGVCMPAGTKEIDGSLLGDSPTTGEDFDGAEVCWPATCCPLEDDKESDGSLVLVWAEVCSPAEGETIQGLVQAGAEVCRPATCPLEDKATDGGLVEVWAEVCSPAEGEAVGGLIQAGAEVCLPAGDEPVREADRDVGCVDG
nr:hypothetical protein Itr_chr07CG05350 [Ipomoea trifida]